MTARRPGGAVLGTVALAVGVAVLVVTGASQAGLLGGHDFFGIAVGGFVAAVFCSIVALETRSGRAALGAVLSALPVGLLVYYLSTSDG